jgi:CheY-like chemotaxis protein
LLGNIEFRNGRKEFVAEQKFENGRSSPMTRPKLLCVDDDAAVRELYRVLFGSYGYQVTVADSGDRALELFRSQPFDGVVVDHEMPGLKGSEMAAMLKHEAPDIPVIMVSGCQSVVEDAPRFVDAAVTKGSPVGLLLDKVGLLLGSQAPARPKHADLYSFVPLGSALAATAFMAYLVPRLWR